MSVTGVTDRFHPSGLLPLPATGQQVAQFIASRAAACVGAAFSNLALLGPTGDRLELFHGGVLDLGIAARYRSIPFDAPYPIARAAGGQVVLLADLDEYRARYPGLLVDTIAAGYQATASLPLCRADGSTLGAIGFAWGEPMSFDAKLEAALRGVASLCTETMERAERYDAEHAVVVELQDRLLGQIPPLVGTVASTCYLPARETPQVGGDWYEGLLIGDSELAVVVGDVAGHGVVAAADMSLIRGMVNVLLHAGVAVSEVFGEVSGVIDDREAPLLATAALAVIDVAADTVTFATAGHPPPLLVLPDGGVRRLSTANGPMLGISTRRAVADTAPFPRGAQLVMYTDGLVETRHRPFDVGVAEAADHLASLPNRLGPGELIASLLDVMVGGTHHRDDIAIVVIENTGERSAPIAVAR